MKTLRAILAGLFFLWSSIAAPAMLTVNELNGFNVGVAPSSAPPTLTFLQCADADGLIDTTFTAQNVGTAGATRATILGITIEDTANTYDVTAVTVGGDSATEIIEEGATGQPNSAVYILSNPVGTSEDVVVTTSEDVTRVHACLWAVTDLSSLTAVAATVDEDPAGGALVLNLSATSADGVAVGVCNSTAGATTTTWTGLTENEPETQNTQSTSSAQTSPTNGSALSIGCDWLSGNAASGAAAAFR